MKPLDDSRHVLLDAIQGLSLAAAHRTRLAEDNNDPKQQYLTLIQVCDWLYTIHTLLIALARDAGGKALVAKYTVARAHPCPCTPRAWE
jgi:hypothetical protein